jgi:outer membrane protein assembly factor BamB/predicted phosphodiesterase
MSECPHGVLNRRKFLPRPLVLSVLVTLLPFAVLGQSNAFKFAWLSDTHVGATTGEEDLRASVRDINSRTDLSFVIISGDVTEYGSREQLRLAHEILQDVKIPCHVIPGNHDTKWSESGGTDFPQLWKDEHFDFEYGGFRFIGMHEGPLMKMGDGHWSPQDVRWLKETLQAIPNKKQPIIFVTHYPVDDGIANWFVVLDLLKQYNVQEVLCGHIHRNSKASFEGVPGVMARSNLRGTASVGGYTIAEVKNGDSMSFVEHKVGAESDAAPWHSIALEEREFASDTNHYPRPDFSINSRFPSVVELWHFDTGYTIASTPALYEQTAIVGDASGTVYDLSLKSGEPRWKFQARSAVFSTPAVTGEMVVFASTDGNIYALKAATGKELWRHKTGRPIVASPAASDKAVFIGSSDGRFRALDLATGKLLWQFEGLGGFVETKPLLFDGKVIFGAWDEHLYALDAKTGKQVWKWKGDKPGTLLSPAACWPIAANGKVFIVAPDRKMTALDAKTGAQIWRTGAYVVRESIGLSEDRKAFYVRTMQDFIDAFSTSANTPEKIWETNAAFGYDINSAMLVEKDGMVFYGTKNGVLYALDAHAGAIKWQHKVSTCLINTVVPLSSTQVLLTDFDGKVALIEAGK